MVFSSSGLLGWLVVALIVRFLRAGDIKVSPVLTGIAFAVVSSALLLLAYCLYEDILQARLSMFDLDGDGVFSPSEQTPGQELAIENLINDSGRSFVKFLGVGVYWFLALLSMFKKGKGCN